MEDATLAAGRKIAPKQLSDMLGVTTDTLGLWRRERKGPPYHRVVGRIYYYLDELEAWRESTRWR